MHRYMIDAEEAEAIARAAAAKADPSARAGVREPGVEPSSEGTPPSALPAQMNVVLLEVEEARSARPRVAEDVDVDAREDKRAARQAARRMAALEKKEARERRALAKAAARRRGERKLPRLIG